MHDTEDALMRHAALSRAMLPSPQLGDKITMHVQRPRTWLDRALGVLGFERERPVVSQEMIVTGVTQADETLEDKIDRARRQERDRCRQLVAGWRENDWPEGFDRRTAAMMSHRLAAQIGD